MDKTQEVKNYRVCALNTTVYDFSHMASQSMKWGYFKCCQKEESNISLINPLKR